MRDDVLIITAVAAMVYAAYHLLKPKQSAGLMYAEPSQAAPRAPATSVRSPFNHDALPPGFVWEETSGAYVRRDHVGGGIAEYYA